MACYANCAGNTSRKRRNTPIAPPTGLLYIDRSDYEPDGFVNTCINDRYRVEHIRGDEYWLYDLEDVEAEPEDYKFRMKIKKM